MPDGFEYDPDKVRDFAAVFSTAASQMQTIQAELNVPAATPEDFGKSWGKYGKDHQTQMAAIAADVAGFAEHLTQLSTRLNETTDVTQNFNESAAAALQKIAQSPADLSAEETK
jgi:uncharacterized protein YukE